MPDPGAATVVLDGPRTARHRSHVAMYYGLQLALAVLGDVSETNDLGVKAPVAALREELDRIAR